MIKGDVEKLKARYLERYPKISDTELDVLFQEYNEFLIIKLRNEDWDGKKFAPSPQIAQIWELHVCDTKSYQKCCRGEFLHFDPELVYNQKDSIEQARAYARLYGELNVTSLQRSAIWPKPLRKSLYKISSEDGLLRFYFQVFSDGCHQKEIANVIRCIESEIQAPKEKIQLKFQTSFETEFWLEIPTTMTISDLNKQISNLLGLLTDQFCLITAEKLDYEDEKTVSHYFSEGDTIYVAISEE